MLLKIDLEPDGLTFSQPLILTQVIFKYMKPTHKRVNKVQGKMNNSEEYIRKTLAQKKKDFDAGGFE